MPPIAATVNPGVVMLRIRLSRVGKKGHPSYRIVVADVAAPRDGSYLEWIGNYDPMKDPPAVTLKEDRAAHWLSVGAQPSDPVLRILEKSGVMSGSGAAAVAVEAHDVVEAPAAVETPVEESGEDS
jgi:small subunit ribosomal protein S16